MPAQSTRGAPSRSNLKHAEIRLRTAAWLAWVIEETGARSPEALEALCRTHWNAKLIAINQKALQTGNDPIEKGVYFWGVKKQWEPLFESVGTDGPRVETLSSKKSGLVEKLEVIVPGSVRFYEDGPEGLFVHLFSDGDLLDHPDMARRGLTPDILFPDAVENFGEYLAVRQRHGELNLEDTCCAIRLYRLWASQAVPSDSPAPYELLTYCCEQGNVIHALDRWGIRTNLLNYIKAAERERVSSNMSWQATLGKIAVARHLPAESYVDDPIGFHARAQRKPRAAMTPHLIVADTYMAPKATKLLRLSRKELRVLVVSLSGLLILATLSDIAVTHRLNAQEPVLHAQPHLKR